MGGPAARHNNFWQLFARPAGSALWRLATPPGVASNGGLVIAPLAGKSLTAGFRPSLGLTFTPLAATTDAGTTWSAGVLDAALADTPGALAADPASGRVLALLANGTTETSKGTSSWTPVATRRAVAKSAAGRQCRLGSLTAVALSPSGTPLLAGDCAHPGITGTFGAANGTWQLAGPELPASVSRQPASVLQLTRTADGIAALINAGASLLAAWSPGNGHWTVSPALRLGGATPTAASMWPGGAAIILSGRRAEEITPAGTWRSLPALPPGTATLAPGPGKGLDALAVHRATMTIWQLAPAGGTWAKQQVIHVPIQYGSSG
jgi:hypothetical protein